MMAKPLPLNTIAGQPITTKSVEQMMEQMAKMVAPVKTKVAWGLLHGFLTLVLEDVKCTIIIFQIVTSTGHVDAPKAVNPPAITTTLPTNSWCKVMTKEHTDATDAFYYAWVPSTTHTSVIMFGCQLTKPQSKCWTINIIISNMAKIPCQEWLTTSCRSKWPSMRCNLKQTKFGRDPTLNQFFKLFAQHKASSIFLTTYSGFERVTTMCDIPSDCIIATATSSGEFTSRYLYIEPQGVDGFSMWLCGQNPHNCTCLG